MELLSEEAKNVCCDGVVGDKESLEALRKLGKDG